MTRRVRLGLLASGIFAFVTILYLSFGGQHNGAASDGSSFTQSSVPFGGSIGSLGLPDSILTGGAIAPKLGNETLKQELGRASWRLMHTMMARFPDKPSADDSLALQTYIQLFARLYPCGECAAHFQKLLEEYPPQTSSRNAAAGWACFVHNEVNKRLKKDLFDCSKIGDFYDCGCADGDEKGGHHGKSSGSEGEKKTEGSDGDIDASGDASDFGFGASAPAPESLAAFDSSSSEGAIRLEKEEGLSRGG